MPLKKIQFRSGVSRENTRYTSESVGPSSAAGANYTGGWYDCEKVRFRSGFPEKLGGWEPLSLATYLGVCRSLWNWVTGGGRNLIGVGTNLKFYIENGGKYYDITPVRITVPLATDPFSTTAGSTTVTVTAATGGYYSGDFVTFSNASAVGGLDLNGEYRLTATGLTPSGYTIQAATAATSTATGGGASVSAAYQLHAGSVDAVPFTGWGAGSWGAGPWGVGTTSNTVIRLWSQTNFGEGLVFGPRGGGIYFWDAAGGLTTRAVNLVDLAGADASTPTIQNFTFVSDVANQVFAFGCNDYGSGVQDPMLIRWSDRESLISWTPDAASLAGSLRLSHGSEIVTCLQARQEIVVLTDSSLYSLQSAGADLWKATLLGDNISVVSQNAAAFASGKIYWMGVDKFYMYDGRVQTLRCDLRQYIYSDINLDQQPQFFASTNEGFNEVWWFYCSANSTNIDKYVVYNYAEDVWYYGTMARTAWLDSGLQNNPIAATYNVSAATGRLVNHEVGVDDNIDGTPVGMVTSISSSEFDIDDGHNFGFIWRMLPDITFRGSTGSNTPQVQMTLIPLINSGSGYSNPQSEGGTNTATVQRITTVPVEQFTGQVFVRVRGRQIVFKIDSTQLGTAWQIGSPRIDIRADGRR